MDKRIRKQFEDLFFTDSHFNTSFRGSAEGGIFAKEKRGHAPPIYKTFYNLALLENTDRIPSRIIHTITASKSPLKMPYMKFEDKK